jgi:hypothetical protein
VSEANEISISFRVPTTPEGRLDLMNRLCQMLGFKPCGHSEATELPVERKGKAKPAAAATPAKQKAPKALAAPIEDDDEAVEDEVDEDGAEDEEEAAEAADAAPGLTELRLAVARTIDVVGADPVKKMVATTFKVSALDQIPIAKIPAAIQKLAAMRAAAKAKED